MVRGTIQKRNIIIKVKGDEISFTKFGAYVQTGGIEIYALLSVVCGNIFIHYFNTTSLHTFPKCCKRDLVPTDFNVNIALFYSFSDLYAQPEDGLTGRGRNM